MQGNERRKAGRRVTDLDSAFNDGYKLGPLLKPKTALAWASWIWGIAALLIGSWTILVAIVHAISIAWIYLFAKG